MVTAELNLEDINTVLATHDGPRIVEWAAREFGDELVMSSSFGADAAVTLHMATRVMPRIRIIMVDTGYLFPETHQYMEQLRRQLDLNVWVYRTKNDPIRYLQIAGEEDPKNRHDTDRCCSVNKNEPFDRAIQELSPRAWLRGVRGGQTKNRSDLKAVEWSDKNSCYAISPLLGWQDDRIRAYLKEHNLPEHPLFDQGYKSIGCNPLTCTRPVLPGEDPRAGRWSGLSKTECGLNIDVSVGSHI